MKNLEARSWASLLVPYAGVVAIVLSALTLASQLYQFRAANEQQRDAAERSQWRDALRSVSFKGDSALSSVFQMQSFFDSPTYGASARTISALLLPHVGSEAAFDAVYSDLRKRADAMDGKHATIAKNEADLVTAAQAVVFEDWKLFHEIAGETNSPAKFIHFVIDPSPFFRAKREHLAGSSTEKQKAEKGAADDSAVSPEEEDMTDLRQRSLSRALRYSWEIGTISSELSLLWKNRLTNPGPAKMDLIGLVLEGNDFSNVDFSGTQKKSTQLTLMTFYDADLTGANFTNTILDRVAFTGITNFSGSKWGNANWWDADGLSCDLGHYLQTRYPVPSSQTSAAKSKGKQLVKVACDQEEAKAANK